MSGRGKTNKRDREEVEWVKKLKMVIISVTGNWTLDCSSDFVDSVTVTPCHNYIIISCTVTDSFTFMHSQNHKYDSVTCSVKMTGLLDDYTRTNLDNI